MSPIRRQLRDALVSLFLFLLATQIATAQTTSSTLSGSVIDSSGALVPEASVILTHDATQDIRQGKSNASGEFVFTALRPGAYTLVVEKSGFQPARRTGILVATSDRLALGNIMLSVGQEAGTVTVSEQAASINTEHADTAPELTQAQIKNIPVAGRDVMGLLRVLPGVGSLPMVPWGELSQNDPSGPASNGGQYGSFTPNVGGARLFWNTVMVDGQVGSNPDFPGLFMSAISMDSVSEAKIISNNYTSEYGRNPGPTISLVTKSGTSDYHGSVYFYKRHEQFNANDFFNNRNGLAKPQYRFGTLGAAVGGPIFIPGHFNRDRRKLFFYFSHESWTTKLPQGISRFTVPTAAERQGDFSQTVDQAGILRTIKDPSTGAPFPGNKIPVSRLNPNGQLLLNQLPLPNRLDRSITQGAYNFEWQDICDIPKRLDSLRLDYNPNQNDRVSVLPRQWHSDTRSYTCNVLGYGGGLPIFKHHYKYLTNGAVLNWMHIFSPSIVNELSTGFTGEKERGMPDNLFGRTIKNYFDPIRRDKTGFTLGQFYPGANQDDILPQALFDFVPGAPDITADSRFPDHQGYERFHFTDNFSWTVASHTFKFGFYFERNWATDGPSADCFDGCFDFSHDVYNPLDTGWDFSNALLGNFRQYSESNARRSYQGQSNLFEWFAQDTVKIKKRLTLDIGARFSYFTPWYVGKGQGANFYPDVYRNGTVPPFYRPVQDPNGPTGTQVAQNPVTGELAPAVYIGAFTSPFNYPGMVMATDRNYPRGFIKQPPVQVAPRIGFALDLFGDGKTAIRGGFGIVKETLPSYSTYILRMVSNPPIQIQPAIFYGNMNSFLTGQNLLFPVPAGSLQTDAKVPNIYKYSFGVQREILRDTTLDVSYVGNVAHHLIQSVDVNRVPYGARFLPENQNPVTGGALPDDFFRPYPGYGRISQVGNFGWSNFNSLQVALNRRMSRGFQYGVSYTWGRSMGTGSNDGDRLASYRPWRIWNYGPTIFDQRQILTFNYSWDLPKASKLVPNAIVKAVFDNWQVSGVSTFATGLPQPIDMSTSDGADITGGGDGVRANVVGSVASGGRTFNRWFNPAAFARPPQGYYGNASVYPFYGPGQSNWDITLMKRIPLFSETRAIEFRSEFYNAFNHTQYASVDNNPVFDPDGKQINGQFGQVVATRFPRVIQFSLRLEF